MTAACHEPGNGGKPRCVRDSDFDAINERLDGLDSRTGEMMRQAAAARSEAKAAHEIGRKVLDEVIGMRGELRESEDRRNRECDIRHRPLERRLDRLEDHDDTLTANSAVTYSDEALRRRYEERKAEVEHLTDRVSQLERTTRRESEARHAAQSEASASKADAEVERQKATRAMWVAIPAIVVAVAGIVLQAMQMVGK